MSRSPSKVEPAVDRSTLEKIRNCTRAKFPICLNDSLVRVFGVDGKKTLDRIVMNDTFENTPITRPNDVWNLYDKYIERVANILGDSVAQVMEFESFKEMNPMLCTKCPAYRRELANRKASGEI